MNAMKISEKTCCWICGRNPKELKNAVETYWESGEPTRNIAIDVGFDIIDLERFASEEKMQIPVCIICSQLVLQRVLAYLKENLEVTVRIEQPEASINL